MVSSGESVCGTLGFAVVVFRVMVVAVVADETDVNTDEEGEHKRLHETDEQLQKVKGSRQPPFLDTAHGVHQILTAVDVAEKTKRKRNRAKNNRDDFDQAGADKDEEKRIIDYCGGFLFVRLVAEYVLQHKRRAGVTHDEIKPSDECDGSEGDGAVHIGCARADPRFVDHKTAVGFMAVTDRADTREKTAPVLNQYVGEETDEQRKGGFRYFGPNDRRGQIEDAFDEILNNGLAAGRDELGPFDGEADGKYERDCDGPAGDHAVRDGQRTEVEQSFGR